jgi:hypothetical protein
MYITTPFEKIHQLRAVGDCLARTGTPGPSAEAPCRYDGTLRVWPNGHACLLDKGELSQGFMGAVCRFKRAATMGSTMPKCLLIMPSGIAKLDTVRRCSLLRVNT